MLSLILTAILLNANQCPEPVIINMSNEVWNKRDEVQLASTRNRCSHYFKSSPCLKQFIKMEPGTYRAICGAQLK